MSLVHEDEKERLGSDTSMPELSESKKMIDGSSDVKDGIDAHLEAGLESKDDATEILDRCFRDIGFGRYQWVSILECLVPLSQD